MGRTISDYEGKEIEYRERRLIYSLYYSQRAIIRVEDQERPAKIKQGVRQGCSISLLLFNLYVEEAVEKIKGKFGLGITVQEKKLQC